MFVYLSTNLSIYLSLSIYPSMYLSTYPSINLSKCIPIHLCIYQSIHPSNCLPSHLSIYQLIYIYMYIYSYLYIYLRFLGEWGGSSRGFSIIKPQIFNNRPAAKCAQQTNRYNGRTDKVITQRSSLLLCQKKTLKYLQICMKILKQAQELSGEDQGYI